MLRMRHLLLAVVLSLGLPAHAADSGTVLVTGANRGIGLEFVRQYAERGWTVIATARKPADATELAALAKRYPASRPSTLRAASRSRRSASAWGASRSTS